jgi:hypothetical protein
MTADLTIVAILDETTQALAAMDMPKLLELEERAQLWASSATSFETRSTRSFRQKHRQLGLTLDATRSNLNLLRRVCGKETGSKWVL